MLRPARWPGEAGDGAGGGDFAEPAACSGLPAGAIRPLQLPTCCRRGFGAYFADDAAPPIEFALSPRQTAKRGGDGGGNVRR
eukprot:7248117-Lingulodinium_polyedra.AAC.1